MHDKLLALSLKAAVSELVQAYCMDTFGTEVHINSIATDASGHLVKVTPLHGGPRFALLLLDGEIIEDALDLED